MIEDAVGKTSSGCSSIVSPVARSRTQDSEHAVEAGVDGLDPRPQLRDEVGLLRGEPFPGGGHREEEGGGGEGEGASRQGCFHALSNLTMPVGPMTTPRTSRRCAVKTEEW